MSQDSSSASRRFDYVSGSIVRIKLQNFMTYDYGEFKCGPRLNLVLGANGTGKSSIVCAICIGFNGKPSLLGRQSQVHNFIKNGCTSGSVEIEIKGKDDLPNPILRRELHKPDAEQRQRSSASVYFVDNRKVDESVYNKYLKTYNIQVDNMCQFLPQDKVGEFSKLDRYGLFEATVGAALGKEYLQRMENIRRDKRSLDTKQKEYEAVRQDLEHTELEVERYRPQVERMAERKTLEQKIENYNKKVPWVKFDECRQETAELTKERDDLKAEYEAAVAAQPNLSAKIKVVEKDAQKCQKKFNACLTDLTRTHDSYTRVADGQLMKLTQKIETLKDKLVHVTESRNSVQDRIAESEAKINKLTERLDALPELSVLTEQRDKFNHTLQELKEKCGHVEMAKDRLEVELRPTKMRLLEKQRAVAAMGQRENKEERLIRNCRQADRIRNNLHNIRQGTAQGAFVGRVHGPFFLALKAKNDVYRQFLENAANANNLSMFITESPSDRDQLLKQMSLVNVDPQSVRQPRRRFTRDQLERLGLDGYLDEFLDGEPVVLEAIRRLRKVDQMICASKVTDDAIDRVVNELFQMAGPSLKMLTMFTKTSRVIVTVSRYSGEKSSNITPLKSGTGIQGRHIVGVVDGSEEEADDKKRELEEEIGRLQDACEDKQTQIAACNEELAPLLEQHKRVQEEAAEVTKEYARYKQYSGKITAENKLLAKHKRELDKDWDQEIDKVKLKLKTTVADKFELLRSFPEIFQEAPSLCFKAITSGMGHMFHGQQHNTLMQQKKDQEAQIQDKKDAYQQAKRVAKEMVQQMHKLLKKAKEVADVQRDDELRELFTTMPNDLEELLAEIQSMEGRLALSDIDPAIVEAFNSKKERLAELRPKVEQLQADLEATEKRLEAAESDFETPVSSVMEEVRVKFEALFNSIAEGGYCCSGTVELIKEEDRYGVGIKVRFRSEQRLDYLNANVQSGGERSLSTFLYILALQQQTNTPFRLVDEINQGMDQEKERLAFERLRDEVTGKKASQYFLVTPKLLRNLPYTDDMTVLFVFNGLHTLEQKKFDFSKFAAAKRLLSGESEDAGSSKRRKAAS